MFCNRCGSKVEPSDIFCNNCGNKLENSPSVSQYTNSNPNQVYLSNSNNPTFKKSKQNSYSTPAKTIIIITIIVIALITIFFFLFIINLLKTSSYNTDITDSNDNLIPDYSNTLENSNISEYQISGNSWVEYPYNSLLELNVDRTFKYYQTKYDLTNNYYEGTYDIYLGKQAIQYVTYHLTQYGVTEEELEDLFARNSEYNEENFCCLILTNEKCMVNGLNTLTSPVETPYYGFYLEGDILDLANMNAGNYITFKKQ